MRACTLILYLVFASWVIFHAQNQLFEIFFQGQINSIQVRPDILSSLIWVQSVCKGYEQRTLVADICVQ